MIRRTYAARLAQEILVRLHASPPTVDPERVAVALGAEVVKRPDVDDTSSGLIARKNGKVIIGVNSLHHHNRRRFTIAHEIGHMLLHADQPLIVDGHGFAIIGERREGDDSPREIEANAFAASLLMPPDWISEAIKTKQFDLADESDTGVKGLAQRFGVSQQAMMYRLINLGYLRNV